VRAIRSTSTVAHIQQEQHQRRRNQCGEVAGARRPRLARSTFSVCAARSPGFEAKAGSRQPPQIPGQQGPGGWR